MLLECDPRFFLYDRRKIIGADCQFFRHSFQPQAFQTVIFIYLTASSTSSDFPLLFPGSRQSLPETSLTSWQTFSVK